MQQGPRQENAWGFCRLARFAGEYPTSSVHRSEPEPRSASRLWREGIRGPYGEMWTVESNHWMGLRWGSKLREGTAVLEVQYSKCALSFRGRTGIPKATLPVWGAAINASPFIISLSDDR